MCVHKTNVCTKDVFYKNCKDRVDYNDVVNSVMEKENNYEKFASTI